MNPGDGSREIDRLQRASSGISLRWVLKSTTKLGAGQATARLASFLLYAYITRVFGVGLLGIVALAQTMAMYVAMGTDQGLCLIGARIVARTPSASGRILKPLVKKRLILCAIAVSLGSVYALWGPIPNEARYYVLGFVLAIVPYAFSLDWMALGLNHMGWLGGWGGLVSVLFVTGAVLAMHWTGTTLLPLVLARIASTAMGALLLWVLWHFVWRSQVVEANEAAAEDSSRQLRWGAIFTLGGATIFNLLFNNVDTLILAGMTTAAVVGRYNAGYKILLLVFGGYYLITDSLYPHLSASKDPGGLQKWLLRALPVVALMGTSLAAVIWLFSRQILTLIYGSTLGSVPLVHILVICLPMDFCTALIGVLLVSRGRDRLNLIATSLAATLNAGLNFLLIPRMQARGAAWATVLSYAFLLAVLVASVSRQGALGTPQGLASADAGQ